MSMFSASTPLTRQGLPRSRAGVHLSLAARCSWAPRSAPDSHIHGSARDRNDVGATTRRGVG
jgi:hypothetical protein